MRRRRPRTRHVGGALGQFARFDSRISWRPSGLSARPKMSVEDQGRIGGAVQRLEWQAAPIGSRSHRFCGGIAAVTNGWRPKWWTVKSCASASASCRHSWFSIGRLVSERRLADAAPLRESGGACSLTALLWPVGRARAPALQARLTLDVAALRAYQARASFAAILILAGVGLWALPWSPMLNDLNNLSATLRFGGLLAQASALIVVHRGLRRDGVESRVVWSGQPALAGEALEHRARARRPSSCSGSPLPFT